MSEQEKENLRTFYVKVSKARESIAGCAVADPEEVKRLLKEAKAFGVYHLTSMGLGKGDTKDLKERLILLDQAAERSHEFDYYPSRLPWDHKLCDFLNYLLLLRELIGA